MLRLLMIFLVAPLMLTANAATLMDTEWAAELCEAWNNNETLTTKLDSFMSNDLGRGYKLMNVERKDCSDESEPVQIKLEAIDGKTTCVYGGEVVDELDYSADYAMAATTRNWIKMGTGELGPMRAMVTFKLAFQGPKVEAMANMGPFSEFLLLVGAFESDSEECPL